MPAHPARSLSLTSRQVEVIAAVVRDGLSWRAAAQKFGVDTALLYRWKVEPVFSAALDVARAEYEADVWTRLRHAAGAAADTLIEVNADPDEKGAVRVQAANSILDRASFRAGDRTDEGQLVQPYATRDELVEALAAIPADVLAEALARVTAAP